MNRGYVYVINGFDLRIPYGATQFVTLRSVLNKRGPVIGRFMRVMAESANIAHRQAFRLQSSRQVSAGHRHKNSRFRVSDGDPGPGAASEIRDAALQASLDEIAPTDPRAKTIKPQD